MIICLEGGDGCGKDTIGELVSRVLKAKTFCFPNDEGVTGPMIRSYLRREWCIDDVYGDTNLEMGALAFQALQAVNRMEVMSELYNEGRTHHAVVVRYWQSGWVYGGLDGLPEDFLIRIHECMVEPDLNILLDIDVETALQRQIVRGGDPERYEGKRDFTEKVLARYRELWDSRGKMEGWQNWYKVDANGPVEEVFAGVMSCIVERLSA